MASTRNKNTVGNYELEQYSLNRQITHKIYENGPSGKAYQTNYAGNGLLQGRIGGSELAHNYCDVESFLYGIGTTNLVTPFVQPPNQQKDLQSLNVIDKIPLILPNPLIIEGGQRPRHV